MNKRFRKEIVGILGLSLLLSSVAYCQSTSKMNSETQKHVDEIFQIETQEEMNNYLDELNVEEFITVLDNTASILEESGDTNGVCVFNETFYKNIKNNLSVDDYIELVKNEGLSDVTRCYMIESYYNTLETSTYAMDNSMNEVLRDIFADNNTGSALRVQALAYLDDIGEQDVDVLKSIIDQDTTDSTLNCKALHTLAKIDANQIEDKVNDILSNFNSYTVKEIATASKLLVRNGGDLSVIENVIKQSDNIVVVRMCLIALGESGNSEAIQIFIDNINKYEDDDIVEYFIDKEYQVISNLLKADDATNVELALECVKLAPFQELIEDVATISDDVVNSKVKNLIQEISIATVEQNVGDDSVGSRNTKWDGSEKY